MRGRRRGPAVRCQCGGVFRDAETRAAQGRHFDGSPMACVEVVTRQCVGCRRKVTPGGKAVPDLVRA